MCGILGVCLDIKISRSADDILRLKTDFADLLVAAEVRGTDAAGVYIVNDNSEIVYHKAPVAGSVLADSDSLWDMLNEYVSEKTVAIIGHTRFATHGDPEVNDNNHPIFDHPIIGVHNGVIRNHEKLNKRFAKAAEVDSAAIMALLRVKSKNAPMKLGTLADNLHELEGPFAIAVADSRKPDGIFMARNYNPVNFFRERDAGLLWFASTAEILNDGIGAPLGKTFEMPANTCCRIDSKAVAGKLKYVPIKKALTPVKTITTTDPQMYRFDSTPRVPRDVRKYDASKDMHGDMPRRLKVKAEKMKQAKVCSTCHEIKTLAYMGGMEVECCACVSVADMMRLD